MIKAVGKPVNFTSLLRSATPIGGSGILPPAASVPDEKPTIFPAHRIPVTGYNSACALPSRKLSAIWGPSAKAGVRFGHTDVRVPDFTDYRRSSSKNPNEKNQDKQETQRFYGSLLMGVAGAGTIYAAKSTVNLFLGSLSASADVLALAKIEVKKSDIPEGKNITFKWRGKPLFIRHRTAEEIEKENAVDVSSLRDPEPDTVRTKDPKWLVVIGVCTHLGCVPIANQGDWNGYYCPCHGSHYDTAGRIRKGPAPLNLEIPPYEFVGETIVVG